MKLSTVFFNRLVWEVLKDIDNHKPTQSLKDFLFIKMLSWPLPGKVPCEKIPCGVKRMKMMYNLSNNLELIMSSDLKGLVE